MPFASHSNAPRCRSSRDRPSEHVSNYSARVGSLRRPPIFFGDVVIFEQRALLIVDNLKRVEAVSNKFVGRFFVKDLAMVVSAGHDVDGKVAAPNPRPADERDFFPSWEDGARLVRAFVSIKSPERRQAVLQYIADQAREDKG
jgi:hypothetical protein